MIIITVTIVVVIIIINYFVFNAIMQYVRYAIFTLYIYI